MILSADIYVSSDISNINNLFVTQLKNDPLYDIHYWEVV